MNVIDLRSDTVTLPSPEMREAMYRAEIGDDGYGEDRTTNELEARVAERLGMEASLFVPSGSMANLASVMAFCDRGGEVILGYDTDMYLWEVGAMSALGGLHPHPIHNQPDGSLPLEAIEAAVRPEDVHFPVTQLVCLETPNTLVGGLPLSLDYLARVRALADARGLPVYLDSARLFNAAVALGVEAREIAQHVDALMFCLSKSLSCPVGSMICGPADFIATVHRYRKMLGGQMRQSGVVAAAGLVALEHMIDRLAEDHANARLLAQELRGLPGFEIKPEEPQTNMVFFRMADSAVSQDVFAEALQRVGVLVLPMGAWLRAVTHYGISANDVRVAARAIRQVVDERV